MSRKRPPAKDTLSLPSKNDPSTVGSVQRLPVLRLALFGLAVLIGLMLYYGDAPQQHLEQRQKTLVFLAAPDELLLIWCGGKLSYLSLLDRWPIALLTLTILGGAWLAGRLLLHSLRV